MYYIFDTEQEAEAYNEIVKSVSNFKGTTTDWATPVKHPALNKWAIIASPKVRIEGRQPETLTADWKPETPL